MTTFNIDWIGEYFAANPYRNSAEMGTMHKFKAAYQVALDTGEDTFPGYIQLVRSRPGSNTEFKLADRSRLSSLNKWLEKTYDFSYELSPEELAYTDSERRKSVYDLYTLEEIDELIEGVQDGMIRNVLKLARCGIPMSWVGYLKDVKGNTLTLTTGKKYNLTDDEARILTVALQQSDALDEFNRLVREDMYGACDRYNRILERISKVRKYEEFPYTYGELTNIWELNRYLSNGIADAEIVSERFGTDVTRLMDHPYYWMQDGRISKETFYKIDMLM